MINSWTASFTFWMTCRTASRSEADAKNRQRLKQFSALFVEGSIRSLRLAVLQLALLNRQNPSRDRRKPSRARQMPLLDRQTRFLDGETPFLDGETPFLAFSRPPEASREA